jgi:hypothetical protein
VGEIGFLLLGQQRDAIHALDVLIQAANRGRNGKRQGVDICNYLLRSDISTPGESAKGVNGST